MSDLTDEDRSDENERLVTPDLEEIDNYIKNDPRRRSKNEIFKAAGLSGVKKFRQWEHGGKAYRSSLEALAQVLHDCENAEQITKHPIATCPILDADDPKKAYQGLIIQGLLDPEYLKLALNSPGRFNDVRIADFVWDHYRREMLDLDISPKDQLIACRALCRSGWLREGGAASRPEFFLRSFTPRQQWTAHANRNATECLAIEVLFAMQDNPEDDSDREAFKEVMSHQKQVLDAMLRATERLRQEPSDENAMAVIREDCRFHLGWAGHDPTLAKSLELAIGGHLQPILRLTIVQAQMRMKNDGKLPKGYPTLAELVLDFYSGAKNIFDSFAAACAGAQTLDDALDAVEQHSKSGYDYLGDADALMKSLRPPGA